MGLPAHVAHEAITSEFDLTGWIPHGSISAFRRFPLGRPHDAPIAAVVRDAENHFNRFIQMRPRDQSPPGTPEH